MAAFMIPAALSLATGAASNYMQLEATKAEADAYRFKAERSKLAGEAAITQTKLNNVILQERFNETQSLQAVKFAMQGRTGATVANIIRQDQENLNWDQKFMELTGVIQKAGFDIDAAGYKSAAAAKTQAGYKGAAVGLLSSATQFAKVL